MKIGTSMQDALNTEFRNSCYCTIDFFQLRSGYFFKKNFEYLFKHSKFYLKNLVDLPDKFEDAIQLSEVKKQEIQKAYAEKNKTQVELETMKLMAAYQRNITLVRFD